MQIVSQDPDFVYFNKIYIIQSLNSGDLWSGDEIRQQVWYIGLREKNILVELCNVTTKGEFFAAFLKIEHEISKGGLPFIHFEMHGCETGLVLADGYHILWEELKEPLRALNILTKNNLFISLASCYGGNLLKIYRLYEPCPFYGFVAPLKEEGERDLRDSYLAFFNILLTENDFEKALMAMQPASPITEWVFLNCYAYFDKLAELHNQDHKTNSRLFNQRVKDMVSSFRKRYPNRIVSRNELVRQAERLLISGAVNELFEDLKRTFLHGNVTRRHVEG